MTREQALNTIIYEVAKHGKITAEATRIYVEHKISRKSFDKAVEIGYIKYLNP